MTVVKMFQNTPEGRMRDADADRAEAVYEDRDLMEQGALILTCLLECNHIATVDGVANTYVAMDERRVMCNTPGPRDAFAVACDCILDIIASETAGAALSEAIMLDLPGIREGYFAEIG